MGLHAARIGCVLRGYAGFSRARVAPCARGATHLPPGRRGDSGLALVRGRVGLRERPLAPGADRDRNLFRRAWLHDRRSALPALADEIADDGGRTVSGSWFRHISTQTDRG